jgi:hypothetical protein
MKKSSPLFVGAVAAVITAAGIFVRRFIGPAAVLKDLLQLLLPFFLAFVFAVKPGSMKQKLWNIAYVLGSFCIVLSVLSPFAFQYWVTYVTPAGYPYTQYGLNALYPIPGIFLLCIVFIVGLVVVLTQDVLHKATHRNVPRSTAKQ